MHELAIAQNLVDAASRVALSHGAETIDQILVRIGALSGVEPQLLERAFLVARAGGLARAATLHVETGPVEVTCSTCGTRTAASPNRLVCGACGNWKVRVVAGEELLLVRVELAGVDEETQDGVRSDVERV